MLTSDHNDKIDCFKQICHEFRRSRFFSLFGLRSVVDVTGLLAIAIPSFIFHLFCFVLFSHTPGLHFLIA